MTPTASSDPPADKPPRKLGCSTALVIVATLLLVFGTLVIWMGSVAISRATGGLFGFLGGLPARFQTQQITRTFKESLVSVTPTKGEVLEVAKLEMNEVITDVDIKTLGSLLYLGTTVSEIQVPVVYRYHIKITDEWKLSVDGNVCTVIAPSIHPSQPPAIRTDGMSKKSEAGWLRFNAASNLAALEKGLTPTLERRAAMPKRINQVRDPSRKAIADFVRTWLLKEQQWRPGGITAIVVKFPDEAQSGQVQPAIAIP